MRINDIILESTQEEGVASALGGLSKVGGALAGGIAGIGNKFAQGYRNGRGAVMGTNANAEKANQLRQQADQIDGGHTAQPTTAQAGSNTAQNGTTSASPSTAAQQADVQDQANQLKSIETTIQHLKGTDIDRAREILTKRAALAESTELDELNLSGLASSAKSALGSAGSAIKTAYNKAAPVVGKAIKAAPNAIATGAGKIGALSTSMQKAYQKARGATMTPQDLQRALASMDPTTAKDILNFFNNVHPMQSTPTGDVNPHAGAKAFNSITDYLDHNRMATGTNEGVGYSRFLGMQL
jgi:hypothetical protein